MNERYRSILELADRERKKTKAIFRQLRKVKAKELDRRFREAHEDAFAEIDCLHCANCCRTVGPRFESDDIDRLAKKLRLKPAQFIDQYLRIDEEGDWVLKTVPCPFLGDDNYCSVYEDRPRACRTYPHTNQSGNHRRLALNERNARSCPAVFLISRRLAE